MLHDVKKTNHLPFPTSKLFFLNFFPLLHPTSTSHEVKFAHRANLWPWGICWCPNIHPMPLFRTSFLELQPASQSQIGASWTREDVSLCGCSYWAGWQQKHSEELGQIHISLGLVFNLWIYWCTAVESKIKVSYHVQKGIQSGGSSRSKS